MSLGDLVVPESGKVLKEQWEYVKRPNLRQFFKKIIYLFDTHTHTHRAQAGGIAEGEADSLLSGEPEMGLHPRTLGS